MRKKASIMASCMLLLFTVAACSSEGGNNPKATEGAGNTPEAVNETASVYPENGLPKDEKVTLKFAYWENGMAREWIDYAIDTFTQKFPNVSFVTTYSPTIKTITGTKIAAGNDDDMFDIFSYVLPSPGDAVNLANGGKLEPQDDLWERKAYDGNGKTLRELAQSGAADTNDKINGKTYAMPIVLSGTGLYFNKSLFEENGWNQNPKTWDEFLKLVDDIKAKDMIPITYPGKYPDYLYYSFGFHKFFERAESRGNLKAFDSDYREYKTPYYASPESIDMHNRIYELGKKGTFPQGVAALSHTQSQMQLLQGHAAMVSTGIWVENEMKDSTPEGFRWGYMSVPTGDSPDDTNWIRQAARGQYYIWAAKPELNKKWAKEFIVWMWNLDVQQQLGEKAGSVPIRSDYMSDQTRAEQLPGVIKETMAFMSANNTRSESGSRNVTLSDPGAEQAKKLVLEALNNIASGKQEPESVLREAEDLLKKAVAAQK
ncbi:extracellular solute-binding protein [Paenibacillus sp. J5C_2022]|uniref:extracellular solute-binding protein n=1 Tax=Paenibacillus sp. J5C2022 TaxID=2977129 RepID=UPI0021CFF4EC|nr:extracellular solute-binding protein [Paenibacillus sp. J5C2022]MCU6710594.1 extracellular solute-binding protein [Paenibacillus sp. J5C2022]